MHLSPVLLLCTGVTLNLYAQHLTDIKFAAPEAHILPTVKFFASLIFAAYGKSRMKGKDSAHPSTKQRQIMSLIGILDAAAYVSFCIGFAYCGTTLSNIVLSACSQMFTALATRVILKKKLKTMQLMAVACVALGLATRSLPTAMLSREKLLDIHTILNLELPSNPGVLYIVLAAFLYSGLGVAYERLVSEPGTSPPAYSEILWTTSRIGATGALAYQIAFVAPRWQHLVAAPFAKSGIEISSLITKLAFFGALFNIHMYTQSFVFRSEGALGVSLITAVRGATIALAGAALMCTSRTPQMCLTPQSALSASLTTLGGVTWVLSGATESDTKDRDGGRKNIKANDQQKLPVPLLDHPGAKGALPWNITHLHNPQHASITVENYLRIEHYKGLVGARGGATFKAIPDGFPCIAARVKYQVFLPDDFPWTVSGKLGPGFMIGRGATVDTCATGGNWAKRAGSIRVSWDGKLHKALGYVYLPLLGGDTCSKQTTLKLQGSVFQQCSAPTRHKGVHVFTSDNGLVLQAGAWNTVSVDVWLNTLGKQDGIMTLTVNGVSQSVGDIVWREEGDLEITGILFSSFFGGSSTRHAPKRDTYMLYRDFSYEILKQR